MDQGLEQFARGEEHSNEEVKVRKKEESDGRGKGGPNRARGVLGQRTVSARTCTERRAPASTQSEAVAGGSQCPRPAVPDHCWEPFTVKPEYRERPVSRGAPRGTTEPGSRARPRASGLWEGQVLVC